jgi:amino acid transporter
MTIGSAEPKMKRDLGLVQATAINMIDMVGIGPFVVMSLAVQIMGGPHYLWAWIVGAAISLIDGFIWSELGAAFPRAGGSYNFLREAYGPKWGRLMSFLFVWQTLIQAPLVIASGAIGFAQYLSYLIPAENLLKKAFSGGVVVVLTVLLYRRIDTIGRISVMLWAGVIATIGWIIYGGVANGSMEITWWPEDGSAAFDAAFFVLLGQASVKTIYCYLGYYNVCHLGSEIKEPERIIPQSIFISVIGIAALYLTMNVSVMSVIPWQEAQHSEFIVSLFIERLYGPQAAAVVTLLVLWVAFASLFAVMLGYSRIPYAAASNGEFFEVFARLHPTKHFPHVSLLGLGATAFVFSLLFRMSDVITAILAMRILVQFVGQAVGVVFIRRRLGDQLPFRMFLYPLPVALVVAVWLLIFISTGWQFALSGVTVIGAGLIAFLFVAKLRRTWPFDGVAD